MIQKNNLSDFITVIVPFTDLEDRIYREIVILAGLEEPIMINPYKISGKRAIAEKIVEIIGEKKSIIIGRKHYNSAFCHNNPDTTTIIFDGHTDISQNTELPKEDECFNDGNFLIYRKGPTYILGSHVQSDTKMSEIFHQFITGS